MGCDRFFGMTGEDKDKDALAQAENSGRGWGGGGGGRVYFMHEDLESSTISDLWAELLMHWA